MFFLKTFVFGWLAFDLNKYVAYIFFWGGECCCRLQSFCIQVDIVNKAGYDLVSTSCTVHPSYNCILSFSYPLLKSEAKPTDSAV